MHELYTLKMVRFPAHPVYVWSIVKDLQSCRLYVCTQTVRIAPEIIELDDVGNRIDQRDKMSAHQQQTVSCCSNM